MVHAVLPAFLAAGIAKLRTQLAGRGGMLAVAAHAGEGTFMPAPEILATRYTGMELELACSNASFVVENTQSRPPLEHEHQGERIYVLATAI